jgi:hypothetical protein
LLTILVGLVVVFVAPLSGCQTGQDNRNMCAPPFRRDRAMASAAASASTSGIGSGSPTYGRDVSETVHRRHHGRRAWSSSVVSRATSAWSRPGRRAARQAIGYGPQFIEHDGDVSRHADLIGCGMAGLSLLDGVLDVNGEGVAGRPGRIRQAPDGPHGIDDDRLPIGAAGEPDRGDIVLPAAEDTIWKGRYRKLQWLVYKARPG